MLATPRLRLGMTVKEEACLYIYIYSPKLVTVPNYDAVMVDI